MADSKPIYSMSFTTGALLFRECLTVVELYGKLGGWEAVRDAVQAENLLQMRTRNASVRICREVISRLKLLTTNQIDILHSSSRQEQAYLLWLAVCKRYRFIYEFAADVVREKYVRFDFKLTYDDYDLFFNAKAEWHPEVARVAPATRGKQRQFVFKMMREADLLSTSGQIQPALLTPQLVGAIEQDDAAHFTIYPVTDSAIREWNK